MREDEVALLMVSERSTKVEETESEKSLSAESPEIHEKNEISRPTPPDSAFAEEDPRP
jgi:hypothetical protein